jgi:hypothetical protein
MGDSSRNQSSSHNADTRMGCNPFLVLVAACAQPCELVFRRFGSCGPKYTGRISGLGLLALIGATLAVESPGLAIFCGLFVLVQILHVLGEAVRRWRGYRPHSWFKGTSRFERGPLRLGPLTSHVAEVLTTILAGIALVFLDRGLGIYLMIAAGCMAVRQSMVATRERVELTDLNDRFIEQRWLAERWRQDQTVQRNGWQ